MVSVCQRIYKSVIFSSTAAEKISPSTTNETGLYGLKKAMAAAAAAHTIINNKTAVILFIFMIYDCLPGSIIMIPALYDHIIPAYVTKISPLALNNALTKCVDLQKTLKESCIRGVFTASSGSQLRTFGHVSPDHSLQFLIKHICSPL